MNSWVRTICDSLRGTEVEQITGKLAKFDNGELVGKCALGVISCDVGLVLTEDDRNDPNYDEILEKAGVPSKLRTGLPYLDPYGDSINFDFDFDFSEDLETYIFTLNDKGLSFSQIADFIETTFGDIKDDID